MQSCYQYGGGKNMLLTIIFLLATALIASLCYVCVLKSRVSSFRKADRIKHAFMTNVNHEIRVPLEALAGLANIISDEKVFLSKNEKQNISDQINYNANLMETLLDEVMMFAGNEKEGHQLHDESFSPNVLCMRCMEANMYSIFHRQSVKLNFKRELSDEFFVKSDHHLVELILNKLILNACRFTEHGEVLVGCNTREYIDRLTFYVEDTGGGIPESRLNNLFTWFDNPEDMNDEVELDLAVCQRVAQKLGGMLVRDEHYQRHGTRMLLVLPLK